MTFVELVEGPLWTASLVIFVVGVIGRLVGLLRMRRPHDLAVPRGGGAGGGWGGPPTEG